MRSVFCGFIALCLLAACSKPDSAAQSASAKLKTPGVTVAPALSKDMQRKVRVVGSLAPWEKVTLSNRVAGYVEKLHADLGDRVKPNQPLAQIETQRFSLAVEQARQSLDETLARLGLSALPTDAFDVDQTAPVKKALSELDSAKIKYDRAASLYKQQLMKDFEFIDIQASLRVAENSVTVVRDTAQATLASARALSTAIELKRKDLADTIIRAPDGTSPRNSQTAPFSLKNDVGEPTPLDYVVSERLVSQGEYLREGTALFTLVSDRILKLQARVPERYLAEVSLGQTVAFTVEAYPGEPFSGTISALDPTVDPANRTFLMEATVRNNEGRLRPGSFVQADILTRLDKGVVMVPTDALLSFAGVSKLFVLDDSGDKVRQIEVKPAQPDGPLVEIPAGVKPGQRIVTSGQSKLIDGATVEIRKPAPKQ